MEKTLEQPETVKRELPLGWARLGREAERFGALVREGKVAEAREHFSLLVRQARVEGLR